MSELTARFRVSLEGGNDLINFLDKSHEKTAAFSRAFSSAMSQTNADLLKLGLSAARTLKDISGLNFGIASQARGVLEFRDSVNRLATTANLAEGKIGGLKDQILDVSVASGQMKEQVADALGAFVAKTGDIETARKNLELYAKTATGTGAALSEVALVGAELSQKMGISNQAGALGILAKQGDIGAIEFKDLATRGPQLFAAAASGGMKGEEGVRRIGGLAQLFAGGVGGPGSAARVANSIEGIFRDVGKKTGQQRIGALGIEVGNRDALEVVQDVIRKLGGDDRAIQKAGIFTSATMRGVMTLSKDFRDHGGRFSSLEQFTNAGGGDTIIDEKFRRNSSSGLAALNRTQAKLDRSFDQNLGNATENLARKSDALAKVYDFAAKNPAAVGAGGLAGLMAARTGKNMLANWLGDGKGGGGMGGLGGVPGKPVNVFVTNPGFGGNGPGGAAGPLGGGGGSMLKAGLRTAGNMLPVLGLATALDSAIQGVDVGGGITAGEAGYGFGSLDTNKLKAAMVRRAKQVAEQGYAKAAEASGTGASVEMNPTIIVNVDKDGNHTAKVEGTGTRDPKVKILRGARPVQ